MKKSYFVDGAMALALACTLVGCSKDDLSSGEVSTNSSIDAASDQNWQMLNTGKVNIGINKDAGESYSVKLYANDPFVNNEGTVLAEGTVTSGNTFTSTFTVGVFSKSIVAFTSLILTCDSALISSL